MECTDNRDVENAIEKLRGVVKFIKGSPKRYEVFKDVVTDAANHEAHELRPLCPTRWLMRLESVYSLLEHYTIALNLLEEAQNDASLKADNRAMARSYVRSLEDFDTYFCMRLFQKLILVTNPIHKQYKGREVTVRDVPVWVSSLISTLSVIAANDATAVDFYLTCKSQAAELRIDVPKLPRAARADRAFFSHRKAARVEGEDGFNAEAAHINLAVQDHFSKKFKDVFKTAAAALIRRYSDQDLCMAELFRRSIEDPSISNDDLCVLLNFYVGDLPYSEQFRFERQALFARVNEGRETTYRELRDVLTAEPGTKAMLSGIHTSLVLYMILPSTSCDAERSFSMLRRLLNYLRSTMNQERLSSLAMLHCHRDVARAILSLEEVMAELIGRSTVRRNMLLNVEER